MTHLRLLLILFIMSPVACATEETTSVEEDDPAPDALPDIEKIAHPNALFVDQGRAFQRDTITVATEWPSHASEGVDLGELTAFAGPMGTGDPLPGRYDQQDGGKVLADTCDSSGATWSSPARMSVSSVAADGSHYTLTLAAPGGLALLQFVCTKGNGAVYQCHVPTQTVGFAPFGLDAEVTVEGSSGMWWTAEESFVNISEAELSCSGADCSAVGEMFGFAGDFPCKRGVLSTVSFVEDLCTDAPCLEDLYATCGTVIGTTEERALAGDCTEGPGPDGTWDTCWENGPTERMTFLQESLVANTYADGELCATLEITRDGPEQVNTHLDADGNLVSVGRHPIDYNHTVVECVSDGVSYNVDRTGCWPFPAQTCSQGSCP